MQKLINWHQDFSQELLEQWNHDRCEAFEKEQKAEKREEVACRIFLYCWAGFLIHLLAVAILRANLWT